MADSSNSKLPPIVEKNTSSYLKFWTRRRYVMTVMLFFGFFNVYSLRVNLSVAIVSMTTPKDGEKPDFDWDSKQKGFILSSFFYGYICTQVAGGLLARKISGHILYGIGIISTAVLTFFTPLAANAGFGWMITLRVLEGLLEGVTYPCLHAIWTYWAPPLERSRMNSFAFAGSYFATVIIMPISGVLCDTIGWESVFYILGTLAIVWYALWLWLGKASPAKDPYITADEREYIEACIGAPPGPLPPIPWKGILTSTAVLAILTGNFCENWGFYTLLTQMPQYLEDVMNFNLGSTGFLSGLPSLAMGIVLFPSGWLADWLQRKKILTTVQVRKSFNCGAFIIEAGFLLAAGFMTIPGLSVAFLVLGVGIGGFAISGYAVNALDIAPQFASIIMGIQNTFGAMPGILSPILGGYIVTEGTPEQWRIVFTISACVYVFGAVIYGIFARGEVQQWAIDAVAKQKLHYDASVLENNSKGNANGAYESKE